MNNKAELNIINIRMVVEDTCNPSNQDAVEYVREILNEAFGKEEMKEYPRCKLILLEVKHG